MKTTILKVLEEAADSEINMNSEIAREILAENIANAIIELRYKEDYK
jgi:hypothetical protein